MVFIEINFQIKSTWFPNFNWDQKDVTSSQDERSRKTSMMSLSSWLPSVPGRKISINPGQIPTLNSVKEAEDEEKTARKTP